MSGKGRTDATRFEGVSLKEVLAGGTGLYEVTTASGVPVRLHDAPWPWRWRQVREYQPYGDRR